MAYAFFAFKKIDEATNTDVDINAVQQQLTEAQHCITIARYDALDAAISFYNRTALQIKNSLGANKLKKEFEEYDEFWQRLENLIEKIVQSRKLNSTEARINAYENIYTDDKFTLIEEQFAKLMTISDNLAYPIKKERPSLSGITASVITILLTAIIAGAEIAIAIAAFMAL